MLYRGSNSSGICRGPTAGPACTPSPVVDRHRVAGGDLWNRCCRNGRNDSRFCALVAGSCSILFQDVSSFRKSKHNGMFHSTQTLPDKVLYYRV